MDEETYSGSEEDSSDSNEEAVESKISNLKKSYSVKEIENILKSISESDEGKRTGGRDLSQEIIKFNAKKESAETTTPTAFKKLPKVNLNQSNQKTEKSKEEKMIIGAIITISAAIVILIGVLAYVLLS